jgi:uncharacterized membrane protein YdjX (TVP38/TMEM64 family)
MKKLIKISAYTLATLTLLLMTQFSVFAAGENSGQNGSLSGIQVVGGLALLLLVIFLPLMKTTAKKNTSNMDKLA